MNDTTQTIGHQDTLIEIRNVIACIVDLSSRGVEVSEHGMDGLTAILLRVEQELTGLIDSELAETPKLGVSTKGRAL
jgi:hypothetical protein